MAYKLKRKESVEQGVRRIAREQIDKALHELHSETLDSSQLGELQALIRAETTMVSAGTELAAFTALSKNVYIPGCFVRMYRADR